MTFQSKYLTVREAAAMLGISVQRVHQLMAEGKLPCVWKPYGWRKQMRHILTSAVQKRKQLGAQQEAK